MSAHRFHLLVKAKLATGAVVRGKVMERWPFQSGCLDQPKRAQNRRHAQDSQGRQAGA